ncbi:MAG: lytic murein transglycosylase B [Spongiibacteraceae bacterium]|nr:lytic murein transglycosylase B [Spongiibacteraceae bacterium]
MLKSLLSSLLMMCATVVVYADDDDSYAHHPKSALFIEKMVNKHGFDRNYLERLMAGAMRKQSILDAISRPAEKTKSWKQYRKIFLTKKRTEQGREFIYLYANALKRAEREFGVPKEIIAAIIGVETSYGRNKGSYRVVDALATLGFDYPPRSQFFSKQLEEFLLLVKEQKFDAEKVKGSYAGAMGYGQFIPSSYRSFAIDFDGDGVADIINNPVDAIGSVANYFKSEGWRTGEMVTSPASVSANYNSDLANKKLKPKHSYAQLREDGYLASVALSDDVMVTPLRLKGRDGDEHWLGLKNFYVITRYNHSRLYAMAVYQLSETFKQ